MAIPKLLIKNATHRVGRMQGSAQPDSKEQAGKGKKVAQSRDNGGSRCRTHRVAHLR